MQATTGLLLVLLTVPGVGAPAGLTPSAEERQAEDLMKEIEVRRTVARLELSESQRWAMVPVIRAQVRDEAAIREARSRALPAVQPAMEQLRNAVLANQGVSDEVKRQVREAEAPYKKPKKDLEELEPKRALEIWKLLTTSQGMALRQHRPLNEKKLGKLAKRVLEAQDQGKALTELYRKQGLRGEEIARAVAHGRQVLLGNPKPSPELIGKLLDLPASGILNPRPDPKTAKKLQRLLLSETALRVLDPGSPLAFQFEEPAGLKSTITDIQVMNLVNTLYLSPDQTQSLIALGQKASTELGGNFEQRQQLARQAIPTLTRVRDELARGSKPSRELQAELKAFNETRRGLKAKQQEIVVAYRDQARALLNPNQLEMVASFVPCTVPVQSLTNPERVGQVADNDGIERALGKLRKAPPAKVDKAAAKLKKKVAEKHRHKKRTDKEIAATVAEVDKVVAEARALDDAQFEVRKHELAERLAVPAKRAEGAELDKRIVRYLLSPNLAPILSSRLSVR